MDFGKDFNYGDIKKAHFIGIGGIGMSGIARLMLKAGVGVSGSDLKESEITRNLRLEGARVCVGHNARNILDPDAVVISSAVKSGNPELDAALKKGLRIVPRALMLAKIASAKKTVTVSGSHGKTTTTSMLAAALAARAPTLQLLSAGFLKT